MKRERGAGNELVKTTNNREQREADAISRHTFLEILVDIKEGLFKGLGVLSLLKFLLGDEGVVQAAAAIPSRE